ncbi:MAG: hydroxypyruvate isomerase family protein [Henriciella sp.]
MIDRRNLLLGSAAFAASIATACASSSEAQTMSTPESRFKMKFAPHDGMFRQSAGEDIVDQIEYAADQGFTAWEDNGLAARSVEDQIRIGAALARRDMQMGVYVAGMPDGFWQNEPVLSGADPRNRDDFLKLIAAQAETAQRVNAKWTTVVPGFADRRLPLGFQTANIIELLKRASDIYAPLGLTMVLEPLNTRIDHPGMFLTGVAQAYEICVAVDRPQCKILFDIYHEQIEYGNLIPTIDKAWDQTAYYQMADNPGRKEPGTGEINYHNVLGHIHAKGFDGIIGMEHGNAQAGIAGEEAVIAAYRSIDQAL